MLYHMFEMTHAAMSPARALAEASRMLLDNPANLFGTTATGKAMSAALEVFEGATRRYGKPAFNLDAVEVGGRSLAVIEEITLAKPFCQLRHFRLDGKVSGKRRKMLIVAPMSGHYATLLRGTVHAMLADHDVTITDWVDARMVPASEGGFDLDDFISYLMDFLRFLGPDTHIMGVCQPGPAVLAATALMAEEDDPCQPASMILMGSPIDPRLSPTVPNELATRQPLEWFENNVIVNVPFPHPGVMRRVYPGFLQLTGFMTMNLDRHIDAHIELYNNLVAGDGDETDAHKAFYDEYLSVMDLTAEFYLQTIDHVFQRYSLPKGEMVHRGRRVRPELIKRTALMTVEGEKDDISGIGQTQAAHDICVAIPAARQLDYVQEGVGHYGVFNGRRWRTEITPRIAAFTQAHAKLG